MSVTASEFVAHNTIVTSLCISPISNQILATGGEDTKVNIWNLTNNKNLWQLKNNKSKITSLNFDPLENYVISGSHSGSIKIFDLTEGKLARNLGEHTTSITSTSFHPYADFLISGSQSGDIKIWDVRTKENLDTLTKHNKDITCLKFSPDGKWITSSSKDGTILFFDLTAYKYISSIQLPHNNYCNYFDFSPCDISIVTNLSTKNFKFFNLENINNISYSKNSFITSPELGLNLIKTNCYSNLGNKLYTPSKNGLKCWDIDSVDEKCSLNVHLDNIWEGNMITDMKINKSNDTLIAAGYASNYVNIYNINLGDDGNTQEDDYPSNIKESKVDYKSDYNNNYNRKIDNSSISDYKKDNHYSNYDSYEDINANNSNNKFYDDYDDKNKDDDFGYNEDFENFSEDELKLDPNNNEDDNEVGFISSNKLQDSYITSNGKIDLASSINLSLMNKLMNSGNHEEDVLDLKQNSTKENKKNDKYEDNIFISEEKLNNRVSSRNDSKQNNLRNSIPVLVLAPERDSQSNHNNHPTSGRNISSSTSFPSSSSTSSNPNFSSNNNSISPELECKNKIDDLLLNGKLIQNNLLENYEIIKNIKVYFNTFNFNDLFDYLINLKKNPNNISIISQFLVMNNFHSIINVSLDQCLKIFTLLNTFLCVFESPLGSTSTISPSSSSISFTNDLTVYNKYLTLLISCYKILNNFLLLFIDVISLNYNSKNNFIDINSENRYKKCHQLFLIIHKFYLLQSSYFNSSYPYNVSGSNSLNNKDKEKKLSSEIKLFNKFYQEKFR